MYVVNHLPSKGMLMLVRQTTSIN